MNKLISIMRALSSSVSELKLNTPSHVYNPLEYARSAHELYLSRYGERTGRILLMGMNPGPWGMAQTGVPFGDVTMVRNWLRIEGPLRPPLPDQHPKYPISGFACARREGSGKRLWEWAAARFGGPEKFFESYFVINYCPLLFIAHEKNLTPERLSRGESERLTTHCNHYLEQVLAVLNPSLVVGVGRYAERQLRIVAGSATGVTYLPHPSPANPAANRGWADIADRILQVES